MAPSLTHLHRPSLHRAADRSFLVPSINLGIFQIAHLVADEVTHVTQQLEDIVGDSLLKCRRCLSAIGLRFLIFLMLLSATQVAIAANPPVIVINPGYRLMIDSEKERLSLCGRPLAWIENCSFPTINAELHSVAVKSCRGGQSSLASCPIKLAPSRARS